MENNAMVDISYLAGLFDGEGYIYICKTKPTPKRRMLSCTYYLYIGIGITNKGVVDWITENFGGNVGVDRGTNYPMYRWRLASKKAESFLAIILPYLKIKKEQARLGIEFRQKCGTYVSRKGLSEEQLLDRENYRRLIKEAKSCQTNSWQ